MKPPLLHTALLHRVMFDVDHPRPHVESFFIKANDPRHPRAVWLRLTLFSTGGETHGDAWAILFDRAPQQPDGQEHGHLAAKERHPLNRIRIDPERAGIGMGPCTIEENHSYGSVQGNDFSISWDLTLEDEQPPYHPFPSERLYRSPLVGTKTVTPHPSAKVDGIIEVWHGKTRNATRRTIPVQGWRGMQGHNWGRRHSEAYAWAHCNAFDDAPLGTFFEAFSARARVGGLLTPPVVLGRVVLDGEQYRFDTWANFRGAKTEHGPTHWSFTARGPNGTVRGKVVGRPEDTLGLTYDNPNAPPIYCLNTKLAELTLELTPKHGASRTLHSSRCALEVGTRDTGSGITMVL